jgi:hypothetical protein
MKLLKILFFIVVFLGGLYFYTQYANSKHIEGLTTMNGELRCPNLLIQKGTKYFLYNSNIAKVPGVNPIEFNNLEEYVEFLEWQRGAGIRCPVLYLQNTYDAQGERVYKIRPSVTELQGGLPPTVPVPIPTKPADGTQTNAFYDTPNTITMNKDNENLLFSDNAMDDNWGGADYTQSLVDSGYYAGNEVDIKIA